MKQLYHIRVCVFLIKYRNIKGNRVIEEIQKRVSKMDDCQLRLRIMCKVQSNLSMFKKYSGMYSSRLYKNTDNKCGLFGVLFNNIVD